MNYDVSPRLKYWFHIHQICFDNRYFQMHKRAKGKEIVYRALLYSREIRPIVLDESQIILLKIFLSSLSRSA
jgi:hypothetical protein